MICPQCEQLMDFTGDVRYEIKPIEGSNKHRPKSLSVEIFEDHLCEYCGGEFLSKHIEKYDRRTESEQ